jgi:hypothetical protein
MKVTVCGPNLRVQSYGEFHVHSSDCGELEKYGPGQLFGGEPPWQVGEADDRLAVTEAIYADVIAERGERAEVLLNQLRFYPCCSALPRRSAASRLRRFEFNAAVAIEARDEGEARRLLGVLVEYRGDNPAGFSFELDESSADAELA